jgi:hypothetical protein
MHSKKIALQLNAKANIHLGFYTSFSFICSLMFLLFVFFFTYWFCFLSNRLELMRQIYNTSDNSPEFMELATTKMSPTSATHLNAADISSCSASFKNFNNFLYDYNNHSNSLSSHNNCDGLKMMGTQSMLTEHQQHYDKNASHLSLANLLPSRLESNL